MTESQRRARETLRKEKKNRNRKVSSHGIIWGILPAESLCCKLADIEGDRVGERLRRESKKQNKKYLSFVPSQPKRLQIRLRSIRRSRLGHRQSEQCSRAREQLRRELQLQSLPPFTRFQQEGSARFHIEQLFPLFNLPCKRSNRCCSWTNRRSCHLSSCRNRQRRKNLARTCSARIMYLLP